MCLIPIEEWINKMLNHLNCNSTNDFKECFETFDISEEEVYYYFDLLQIWYDKGLTPVEALRRLDKEIN